MNPAKKIVGHATFLLLAVAAAAPLVGGCSSSSKVENRNTSVSVGQELQDLENARNKGLLTEAEYQKKRAEIMKRK